MAAATDSKATSINNTVEKLREQIRLHQARFEKLNQQAAQFDFNAIEKFLSAKGLVIERCTTNNFAESSLTQDFTQEQVDNAKLSYERLLTMNKK